MLATILENQARADDKILHCGGDEHLARRSERADTSNDRYRDARDVCVVQFDFAGMEARADLDPE